MDEIDAFLAQGAKRAEPPSGGKADAVGSFLAGGRAAGAAAARAGMMPQLDTADLMSDDDLDIFDNFLEEEQAV